MKKTIALFVSLVLMFTLGACSNSDSSESNSSQTGDGTGTDSAVDEPENRELVVYFSCTGNTKKVAEEIADQTGANLYEIEPEQPYTEEDLNYGNDNSRANREMNNENARPEISGKLENISDYDIFYIGYPIWWGDMPKILNTFFDTHDMSGKTIMPFCTSGGSGISKSVNSVKHAEPEAVVKEGLQISGSSSGDTADEVSEWLNKDN